MKAIRLKEFRAWERRCTGRVCLPLFAHLIALQFFLVPLVAFGVYGFKFTLAKSAAWTGAVIIAVALDWGVAQPALILLRALVFVLCRGRATRSSELRRSLRMRRRGDAALAARKSDEAVLWLSQAIELKPRDHIAYARRSAAHLDACAHTKAMHDADWCIRAKPNWSQGYLRRARCLDDIDEIDGAIRAAWAAHANDPKNLEVERVLDALLTRRFGLELRYGADTPWSWAPADANSELHFAESAPGVILHAGMDAGRREAFVNPALAPVTSRLIEESKQREKAGLPPPRFLPADAPRPPKHREAHEAQVRVVVRRSSDATGFAMDVCDVLPLRPPR